MQLRFTVHARDRFDSSGGNTEDKLNVTAYLGAGASESLTNPRAVTVVSDGSGTYSVDYSDAIEAYRSANQLAGRAVTLEVLINPQLSTDSTVSGTPLRWCPAGKRGVDANGVCVTCGRDRYSNELQVGVSECTLCKGDTVTAPEGSTSARNCTCVEGYFFLSLSDTTCVPCPATATCAGGLDHPRARRGFQADPTDPAVLYACPNADACECCVG